MEETVFHQKINPPFWLVYLVGHFVISVFGLYTILAANVNIREIFEPFKFKQKKLVCFSHYTCQAFANLIVYRYYRYLYYYKYNN